MHNFYEEELISAVNNATKRRMYAFIALLFCKHDKSHHIKLWTYNFLQTKKACPSTSLL